MTIAPCDDFYKAIPHAEHDWEEAPGQWAYCPGYDAED